MIRERKVKQNRKINRKGESKICKGKEEKKGAKKGGRQKGSMKRKEWHTRDRGREGGKIE